MAYRRKRMTRRRSKKLFKRGARRVKKKNFRARPMRGGIRL